MAVEVLPAQDAVLWAVQRPEAPLNIGGLAVFEGAPLRDADGALRMADLLARVESGLRGAPRFRQRVRVLPLGQGVAWVDDEAFDLTRHVRSEAVRPPGGEAELRAHVAAVLEEPFDPDHPLWEVRVLDGLAEDRVALVVKASHVLADGMALVDLTARLVDLGPPDGSHHRGPWRPEPAPGPLPLVALEVATRVSQVAEGLRQVAGLLTDPGVLAGAVGGAAGLVRSLAPGAGRPPRPAVASRVGTRRDLVWARLPLGEVRRVARAEGVTVNDVVLALTAGALAEHLVEPGDGPAPRDPRAVVPVSTHSSNPADEVRNRFAVVVVDLPVGLGDPRARLRRIHADLVERKAGVPGSLGARVFGLAGLVPPRFLRAPGRLALDHQPLADLAVTNMPGPRDALHLLGARMLEVYPMVCGVGNLAIILGVLSYEDALGVCITVDADVVPDPDDLLRGFVEGFDALVEAVDGGGRAPAPGR